MVRNFPAPLCIFLPSLNKQLRKNRSGPRDLIYAGFCILLCINRLILLSNISFITVAPVLRATSHVAECNSARRPFGKSFKDFR